MSRFFTLMIGAALTFAILVQPVVCQAQTDPTFSDVPHGSACYEDLERLQVTVAKLGYPNYYGSSQKTPLKRSLQLTRYEFGVAIARFLDRIPLCSINTTQSHDVLNLREQEPEMIASLRRLVHEFTPEMKILGLGVTRINLLVNLSFSDVPSNHWAAAAVERLRQEGVVVGYPNRMLRGDSAL